jgi:hypothetical protein
MATALLAPNVQMNETRVLGGEVALDQVVGSRVDVYAFKATSASNPTLIPSTGTETFSYTV